MVSLFGGCSACIEASFFIKVFCLNQKARPFVLDPADRLAA
jgi:hypothetical protein